MIRYVLLYLLVSLSTATWAQQVSYEVQRKQMVEKQLKSRDIYNRATLQAMLKVPRHLFVPTDVRTYAYSDGPLPIGSGQTISQPYMVAYMTQALKLKSSDKVLEIGTGSGYQAAILGEIVKEVYTIEIVEELGSKAAKLLDSLSYNHVKVKIGDGYNGWPELSPFDAIIVTAGAERIPQPLIDQLKDGGRMIIPVGPHHGIRQLIQIDKKAGKIKSRELMLVRFVPFVRGQ
jgi:protein-L-isoaspartate(D-aspartate) O-methyltransferase